MSAKLSVLQKCPNFYPKVVFFFNYIAINDNKTTNDYPRPFNWDILTKPLTNPSILQCSLFSADVN